MQVELLSGLGRHELSWSDDARPRGKGRRARKRAAADAAVAALAGAPALLPWTADIFRCVRPQRGPACDSRRTKGKQTRIPPGPDVRSVTPSKRVRASPCRDDGGDRVDAVASAPRLGRASYSSFNGRVTTR